MNKSIGAWNPQDLLNTVNEELTGKPVFDESVPVESQFLAYTLYELRKIDPNDLGTCLFFLHPDMPNLSDESLKLKSSLLFDSGRISFMNKVCFVNLTLTRGRYFEADLSNPDDIIDLIINDYGLGDIPVVMIDKHNGQHTARMYPKGFSSPEEYIISLKKEFLDLDSIKHAIDNLYQTSLITPSAAQNAGFKLWEDSSKFFPAEHIEKGIQGRLYSHFSSHFGCNLLALPEINTVGGRLDLLLISKSSEKGKQINHALLELKALRSFSSSGKTTYKSSEQLEWIDKGMRQAQEYSITLEPYHTVLCCFDMCNAGNDDDYWFASTKQFSIENNIHQWRWKLYNSAESKRQSEIKLS
ncbi:hypothetical protein [Klebsiella variicola]|uniref:hypothetical protein n=1 Tax=Klebsiella variicola TaxID=244366 RepID=UPI0013CF1FA4|nr:hypothetical protein [Klebsiella variicola]